MGNRLSNGIGDFFVKRIGGLFLKVIHMCNSSKIKTPTPPEGITKISESVWELFCPSKVIIPEVDIVFFHGLQRGDFEDAFWKTWVSTDNDMLVWPQQWLSQKFPKARILSVSYNSSATKKGGQADMFRLGENLVQDLILDDHCKLGTTKDRPVFLVGHSLGGIVIKQFILSAIADTIANEDIGEGGSVIKTKIAVKNKNVDKIQLFLQNFKGVFYYATPHGGSEIADLASKIKEVNPILTLLKTLDIERQRINDEFRTHRAKLDAQAFAVAELQPVHTLGFENIVVVEASARQDIDGYYTFNNADHFSVCKARTPNDEVVIQKLTQFITDTVPHLTVQQAVVENTRQEVQSSVVDSDDLT